ncbi:unnamed protein product, partial [Vitis vinifera]
MLFSKPKKKLPPGPFAFPIISSYLWLRKSYTELEPILRNLHAKHGPIVSPPLGNSPAIFVASASLAHEALVQNAAVFVHRPVPLVTNKVIGSNQHNVSSAGYGPTWCLLRRNLTTKIFNPLRLKAYSRAHKWVLEILFSQLRRSSKTADGVVRVVDDFHFAMFCLLVLMCFGNQLEEEKVREIQAAQLRVLAGFGTFNMLNFWPTIGKILFRKRWEKFLQLRKHQEDVNTYYLHIAAAVILEGLRRHPPGHFGLPHAVNQDVNLGGYTIPQNANIFFMVAEIAWNPEVWEDPLELKPERFLTDLREFCY